MNNARYHEISTLEVSQAVPAQAPEDLRHEHVLDQATACNPKMYPRPSCNNSDALNIELFAKREQHPENDRMHVEMIVAVHMRKAKTGCRETLKLRAYLRGQLATCMTAEEVVETGEKGASRKAPLTVNEMGNIRRWQGRFTEDKREVKSDREARVCSRDLNRFSGCRFVDHETRARQHAAEVRFKDGPVDRTGVSKIITVDDQGERSAGLAPARGCLTPGPVSW